jgi:hypothetical protein
MPIIPVSRILCSHTSENIWRAYKNDSVIVNGRGRVFKYHFFRLTVEKLYSGVAVAEQHGTSVSGEIFPQFLNDRIVKFGTEGFDGVIVSRGMDSVGEENDF